MQFNNVGGDGLIQRCEVLTGLGVTGISGNSNLLIQFTGLLNDALSKVATRIKGVDKNVKYDDYNWGDYPDAPITMVVSTNNNTIPVAESGGSVNTNIGINGIYYKESDGSRTYLSPMGPSDTLSDAEGTPSKFLLMGKSIFFNCKFDAATLTKYSSTFYVEFQRSPVYFTTAHTTREPGFLATFHYLLPLDASASYFLPIPEKAQSRAEFRGLFESGLDELEQAVADFNGTVKQRFTSGTDSNR